MEAIKYHFSEKESDITIISESRDAILKAKERFFIDREFLEKYVEENNEFLTSFSPVKVQTEESIIKLMAKSTEVCKVGPMAAVAGAFADLMLEAMITEDSIPARIRLVENGGELAIDSEKPMKIALYAGDNKLNLNIGFLINKSDCPIGIGTSSATIGHAVSLGEADAVTVFAENASLGDAGATYIANLVKGPDIEKSIKIALDAVDDLDEIKGAFISRVNHVGHAGKIPSLFKLIGDQDKIIKDKVENMFPGDFKVFK